MSGQIDEAEVARIAKGTVACICRSCGIEFAYRASAVRRGRGQFCSRACSQRHATHVRWNVKRTPNPPRPAASAATIYERFVIRRPGDQCWGWSGFKHRGYGRLTLASGRTIGAHRVSYEIFNGKIPEGLTVLHRCDNPECSNPKHLSLGTNADNNRDRDEKGRTARGVRNGKSKLTEGLVRMMREEYAAGNATQRQVSERFGVKLSTVAGVLRRRTWAHVA